ncbi:MAG: pyruvate ferredoxin oxidoreductase [Planctomycetota bacterium]|nr:MAG: pyruvate ferredoxin oxidoreductase [Planctomycetota bacterium]
MSKFSAITGNGAIAEAMRQISPDVVAAFPITPSTQIIEDFAKFAADGKVDTELITVESEHSAMSACLGASVAGGRVMTATSANGLALMWEMLYVASGMRQPILVAVVNRALSAPINIHCDHNDSMGARDAGWIQIYAENNQEAYDNMLMAPVITEHADVRLPLMVCLDGFIISHSIETMQLEDDSKVKDFVGEHTAYHALLDTDNPSTWGSLDLHDYYIEHKKGQQVAMENVIPVVEEVSERFYQEFGRKYELFESYCLDDAERVVIAINSVAGELKEVIDEVRDAGEKVGLLKIRLFRPFPYAEIAAALKNCKIVTVLDRSTSMGAYGPLFVEICSALYDADPRPMLYSRTFGLGGRELLLNDIRDLFEESKRYLDEGKIEKRSYFLNVRGG